MRVTLLFVVRIAVGLALPQALVGTGWVPRFRTRSRRSRMERLSPGPRPHGDERQARAGKWMRAITPSCERLLFAVAVDGAGSPHGMEHDGELASDRDDGSFAALGPGQPGAEAAESRRLASPV